MLGKMEYWNNGIKKQKKINSNTQAIISNPSFQYSNVPEF